MTASSFGSALVLASAAKGALLVAFVAVIIAVFRVRSASLRHAFWTSVVLAHLAIPALTLLLPPVRLTMPSWIPAGLTGPQDPPPRFGWPGASRARVAAMSASAWGGGFRAAAPAISVVGVADAPELAASTAVPGVPPSADVLPGTPRAMIMAVARAQELAALRRQARHARGMGLAMAHRSTRSNRMGSLGDAMRTVLSWPAPSPWVVVWFAGALVILVRLAAGTSRVARLAHRAEPVVDPSWLLLLHEVSRELEISRPVTLLRGNRLNVPVTWGIVYPVVLLPPDADRWLRDCRRHVLVHELAHVRRFDALTQLAAQCVLALFWFDPLVWYAVHRMRVERERACDDVVLRRGAAPSRYASDLLELVRALDTSPIDATPAFATLAMARRHDFEGRMLAILDPKPDRRILGTGGAAASALALALMLIPLSALRAKHDAAAASVPVDVVAAVAAVPDVPPVPAVLDAATFDQLRDQVAAAVAAVESQRALDSLLRSGDVADLGRQLSELSAASHDAQGFADADAMQPSLEPPAALRVAPALPAPSRDMAPMGGVGTAGCETFSASKGSSTSIHSNDDGASRSFSYTVRTATRCAHMETEGEVAFNDEATDIERMAPGARVLIEERSSGGRLRRFSATNRNGAIEREYSEGEGPIAFDANARSWLASMIQELVRESGAEAKERTARIRREGGVSAVLDEIGRIESSHGKRAYYEALLNEGSLAVRDLERIITGVGRDLAGSAADLSAVLANVPVLRGRPELYAALEDAIARIDSDGDRARTLLRYISVAAGDRDLLLVVLRAAGSIESDGDKASVLLRAGPEALAAGDDSLRMVYFRAARSIESDSDLRRVLTSAVHFGHASAATSRDLIQTARRIESDGDKAAVLVAIGNARLLVSKELQDAYIDAARSINSDGDYRRVMESSVRR